VPLVVADAQAPAPPGAEIVAVEDAVATLDAQDARLKEAAAEVKRRRAAVPQGLAGADADDVRRLAAAATRAVAKGRRAEAALAELPAPPEIDANAERAVLDAEAWVAHWVVEREAVRGRAVRVLSTANALAVLALAARVASPSAELAVPLIGAAPVAGVLLWVGGSLRSRRRFRRADVALAAALGRAGVPDVEGLTARRIEVERHARAVEQAAAADRAAQRVLRRWSDLAGGGHPPDTVEELLAAESALHAAEADLEVARAAATAPLLVSGAPEDAVLARLAEAAVERPVVLVTDDERVRAWVESQRPAEVTDLRGRVRSKLQRALALRSPRSA
jgi:hypothetical protein